MRASERTPYEVLGVEQSCTLREINARHRRLALELHPDQNLDLDPAERDARAEQLQEINRAYDLLARHRARVDNSLRRGSWGQTRFRSDSVQDPFAEFPPGVHVRRGEEWLELEPVDGVASAQEVRLNWTEWKNGRTFYDQGGRAVVRVSPQTPPGRYGQTPGHRPEAGTDPVLAVVHVEPDGTPLAGAFSTADRGADIEEILDLRFAQWRDGLEYAGPRIKPILIDPYAPPGLYLRKGSGEAGKHGAPDGDFILRVRHIGLRGEVVEAGHEYWRRTGEIFGMVVVAAAALWVVFALSWVAWYLITGR